MLYSDLFVLNMYDSFPDELLSHKEYMRARFDILMSEQSRLPCPMLTNLTFTVACWYARYGNEFLGHERIHLLPQPCYTIASVEQRTTHSCLLVIELNKLFEWLDQALYISSHRLSSQEGTVSLSNDPENQVKS